PDVLRHFLGHMLREETHQHTALRALSIRMIRDQEAGRAEPGEPGRQDRPPPSLEKGDVSSPGDHDEAQANGHGEAPRLERPDPEERAQAGPEEDPQPADPLGRAQERPLTLERDPKELADEVGMNLDARNILLGSLAGAERRIEVVLDALSGHPDQHDAVSYHLGRHLASQDGAER